MDYIQSYTWFGTDQVWLLVIVVLWSIVWKGLALWRAAGRKDKLWYVILLVVNTVGLAEIIYLLATNKTKK